MAGRIGVVREASGLAAYAAGEWNEALSELRAARRITGRPEHLAVMADCERALSRPERALAYADDPAVPTLAQEERVELVIVLAGARRDLGQADAAVLTLQDPARRTTGGRPWAARLWYAYADALLGAGRIEQARAWFEKVVQVDADGATDAGDRLLELDGIVVEDLGDDEEDGAGLPDEELAAYVAEAFPRPEPVEDDAGPVEVQPADGRAPVQGDGVAAAAQERGGPATVEAEDAEDTVAEDLPLEAGPAGSAPAASEQEPGPVTRPTASPASLMPLFTSPTNGLEGPSRTD
jgi:hypothetical protein